MKAEQSDNRRPIKARDKQWPHKLAHFFVSLGMTPNQMSAASVVWAVGGFLVYFYVGHGFFLIIAALCIQLRLIANLLDGLMAVEEGKKTATGALYNEFPDRIADTLFLVGAGYATEWSWLGWAAALLAMATAYVRASGASTGYGQDYCGPMAKQHRMFALTIGSIAACLLSGLPILAFTLAIISIGTAATVVRRTLHIAAKLKADFHD